MFAFGGGGIDRPRAHRIESDKFVPRRLANKWHRFCFYDSTRKSHKETRHQTQNARQETRKTGPNLGRGGDELGEKLDHHAQAVFAAEEG